MLRANPHNEGALAPDILWRSRIGRWSGKLLLPHSDLGGSRSYCAGILASDDSRPLDAEAIVV